MSVPKLSKANLFLTVALASQIGTLTPAFGAEKCEHVLAELTSQPSVKQRLFKPGLKPSDNGGMTLTFSERNDLAGKTANAFAKLFNRPLGIHRVAKARATLEADQRTDVHYYQKLLEALELKISAPDYGFDKIPKEGPLVIVANHPMSGIEGIAIAAHIAKVRPDVMIVSNSLLKDIPGMAENAFLVNPFGGSEARRENAPIMAAMQAHLAKGGTILIFPAGSVSHKQSLKDPVAVDDEWKMGVISMLKKVPTAQVVPIFVNNEPSQALNVAKAIHPALGIPFIVREIMSNIGSEVFLNLGTAITPKELAKLGSAKEVLDYLRARTYLMSDDVLMKKLAKGKQASPRKMAEIGPEINPELVKAELADKEILFDIAPDKPERGAKVYLVRGSDIPNTLLELGRRREITFRDVGEGSGKSYDVDSYDQHYYHLIAWDKATNQIAGAYRLGRLDQIIQEKGTAGVYSTEFFNYENLLRNEIAPKGIELGRSFVMPEFQRRSLTLPALWGAIGRFIATHPQYRNLIGPVSISDEFQPNTKLLIVEFLKKKLMHEHHAQASSKNPPQLHSLLSKDEVQAVLKVHDTTRSLDALIKDIEGDANAKMPPLIPMYLELGARVLTFDHDKNFNTVDALIWVDFGTAPFDSIKKYMGEDGAREYRRHLGIFHD